MKQVPAATPPNLSPLAIEIRGMARGMAVGWEALGYLRGALDMVGAAPDEYVLFGSAPMFFHALRFKMGDVDVFASPYVYSRLRESRWWIEKTPRAGDPSFLEGGCGTKIHVFREWTSRDAWMDVPQCFEVAEDVSGFRCIPLWLVAKIKLAAHKANPDSPDRLKHVQDVFTLSQHQQRIVRCCVCNKTHAVSAADEPCGPGRVWLDVP